MSSYWWFQMFVCLNAGLVTLLALNISRLRMREKVSNGDGDKLVLKKAIRAHGNGVEHVTIFGLCVLALEAGAASAPLLGTLVLGFTLSRVAHAAGMLVGHFNIRRVAAGVTYLFEIVAVSALACQLLGYFWT